MIPGGNVAPVEPLEQAPARELDEEWGLVLRRVHSGPQFTWLLDAMSSRPGGTPPHQLHLVHRVHISADVRRGLRSREQDETGSAPVVWLDYRSTSDLQLFPPAPVAELDRPDAPVEPAFLGIMGDADHQWL